MIRTTYKGREIKILKSTTPHCVKTFVGGQVINHAFQGDDVQAMDWFRRVIDRIDVRGPGGNPYETGAHWYAPGTFDLNARGHVIAPGGACVCNTCLESPEKNVPCTDPTVCQHCPIPQATHARQYIDVVGWHPWTAPTPEQVKGRMLGVPADTSDDDLIEAVRGLLVREARRQPAELITQYGFRLRDSTLLDFDSKAHRDRRMAQFVDAEWEVTPLTRQVRLAQYGEWAEETPNEEHPPNPPHPGGTVYKTVADVDTFAAAAHRGQVDKIGVPYIEHVRAVAAGLASFGDDLVIAGLLHDVLEDTDWTAGQLRAIGIPARALDAVVAVTNQPGVPYEEKIRRITGNPDAVLVKIADNAHNSRPDRAAQLPPEKRERLAAKYRKARTVLWAAADHADIEAIIRIVNPTLLVELGEEAS